MDENACRIGVSALVLAKASQEDDVRRWLDKVLA